MGDLRDEKVRPNLRNPDCEVKPQIEAKKGWEILERSLAQNSYFREDPDGKRTKGNEGV